MIQKEQGKKLLIPKTDVVFQALFGTKGNEEILGGLISKIIKEKVENISLDVNQNLIRKVPSEKMGVLDLRAQIGEKAEVDIEVQLKNKYNISERALFYWAKMYSSQLKKGEKYRNLKKTIQILILDFELKELECFKNAHAEHKIVDTRDKKVIIFKNLEIHIIELPKILKYPKETEIELKRWMEFLINPESEVVKMGAKEDKKLEEAIERLEYISGDEELRRLAELREKFILDEESEREAVREEAREEGLEEGRKEGIREGIKEGIKEGIEQGIRQGIKQGKEEILKETTKRLLNIKMPIKQIMQITDLSEEEIENVKKELK